MLHNTCCSSKNDDRPVLPLLKREDALTGRYCSLLLFARFQLGGAWEGSLCKTSFFCTGPVVVGFKPLIENIFYFGAWSPGWWGLCANHPFLNRSGFVLHFVGLKCAKDKKMFFLGFLLFSVFGANLLQF